MDKILFGNPVFNRGMNLTTRKGNKWAGFKGAIDVVATDDQDKIIGTAKIENTNTVKFSELVDSNLMDEHDPSCRTVEGLLEEMQKVYSGFTKEDEVTLVYFTFHYKKLTWYELKKICNSLIGDQLGKEVIMWYNHDEGGGYLVDVEIVDEDLINPSGDGLEKKSVYKDDTEFDVDDEPVVIEKGHPILIIENKTL